MGDYRLSRAAARDISEIAKYTIEAFGLDQARRYRDSLKETFALLARHPRFGRDIEHIKPSYRRHQHGKHVIYYRRVSAGVVIMRVLHERQNPLRHL